MLISEVITLARSSEIKQLKISEDDIALLGFVNLGVLEIHKRFGLIRAEVPIALVSGVTTYTLDGQDANVPIDLSKHEFIKIEAIDNAKGIPVTINNKQRPLPLKINKEGYSVTTPEVNVIKIPTAVKLPETLTVGYRVSPKFAVAHTETLLVPVQFIEAVILYIAYKAQLSVKAGIKDENNTYFLRFDAECKRIRAEGLYVEDDLSSTKFEDRGFV